MCCRINAVECCLSIINLHQQERAALREANLEKKYGIAPLKDIGKSETKDVKEATKAFGKMFKGNCASAFHDMKYKKLMPTIPKPFRLRTHFEGRVWSV
ncbi:hypothetical protein Sjap_010024 [Stephania japonica]|uniref:Uncharacterized protein n=1 Tax=Stephania japonica TaxID=461633 RepID=A0AAP0J886_9MAGN